MSYINICPVIKAYSNDVLSELVCNFNVSSLIASIIEQLGTHLVINSVKILLNQKSYLQFSKLFEKDNLKVKYIIIFNTYISLQNQFLMVIFLKFYILIIGQGTTAILSTLNFVLYQFCENHVLKWCVLEHSIHMKVLPRILSANYSFD